MKKSICLLVIIGYFLCCSATSADYARNIPNNPSITDLIALYATQYNVSQETMYKVISCESGFKTHAIGDNGTSFGLVQIHLPAHPKITKKQAFDTDFSVNFLAKNISKHNGNIWSCYRKVV